MKLRPPENDGLLTAEEVGHLNLDGTWLGSVFLLAKPVSATLSTARVCWAYDGDFCGRILTESAWKVRLLVAR